MSDRDVEVSNSGSHIWPSIRLGLAAEISALCGELAETEWFGEQQLHDQQMRQFRRLLHFVTRHSPFYAARFAATGAQVGDFQSIGSLRTLPLLRRQDIQSAGEEFFCTEVPADQGKISQTETSGSTGEPVRVRRTGVSQLFWHALSMRNHLWHDLPFAARYTDDSGQHRRVP